MLLWWTHLTYLEGYLGSTVNRGRLPQQRHINKINGWVRSVWSWDVEPRNQQLKFEAQAKTALVGILLPVASLEDQEALSHHNAPPRVQAFKVTGL